MARHNHTLGRLLIATALTLSVAHASVAEAAPALKTPSSALAKSERSKYDEGKRAYDKQDYATAGKTWSALLGKVPESPENRSLRAGIILDTMAAYQAGFEATGDAELLRTGMDAYYAYFKAYRDAHGTSNIPESVVEARFVMKEALAHADNGTSGGGTGGGGTGGGGTGGGGTGGGGTGGGGTGGGGTGGGGTGGGGTGGGGTGGGGTGGGGTGGGGTSGGGTVGPQPANGNAANADTGPKAGAPVIAAGAVMLALGVGATAMIGVGAVEGARARDDQKLPGYSDDQRMRIDQRGRSMNALLISGAVLAPVLAVTGISLIAVGAKNKRKAQLAIAPAVTQRYAGVVLRGRF